ncbi:peptidase S9, partial [Micromonospora parva]
TPGVAPSFEKAIHRRVADVILTDQIDALTALRPRLTPPPPTRSQGRRPPPKTGFPARCPAGGRRMGAWSFWLTW